MSNGVSGLVEYERSSTFGHDLKSRIYLKAHDTPLGADNFSIYEELCRKAVFEGEYQKIMISIFESFMFSEVDINCN